MKKCLVMVAMFLAGCQPEISGHLVDLSTSFCKEHGGVGNLVVRSEVNSQFYLYCADGKSTYVNRTGVK